MKDLAAIRPIRFRKFVAKFLCGLISKVPPTASGSPSFEFGSLFISVHRATGAGSRCLLKDASRNCCAIFKDGSEQTSFI